MNSRTGPITVKMPIAYDIVGETDGNCSLNNASMKPDPDGCYFRRRDIESVLSDKGISFVSDVSETDDYRKDLELWWGLSYASFLVMPRVAMQLMPEEWQEKMAELLNQYDETINTSAFGVKGCTVRALDKNGKMMKTPPEILNYRHPTKETKDALKKKGNYDDPAIHE